MNIISKNSFFLKRALKINKILLQQNLRVECWLCLDKLPETVDFINHKIPYLLCNNCNHLNSKFLDTTEFNKKLYIIENKSYALDYIDLDFNKRTEYIYIYLN